MVAAAHESWTVDELLSRASLALADAPGVASGRVRDVPDLRAVRYYASLGLLARPHGFAGRTALYGKQHLAQLVAIKRLQARGHSLAEVQERLAGLDDGALFALAALPHDALAPNVSAPAAKERAEPAPARRDFWTAAPAQIAEPPPALKPSPELASVALDPRVLLVLDAGRPLDATDLEAIRAAGAPLLKLLQKRGLLGPLTQENA